MTSDRVHTVLHAQPDTGVNHLLTGFHRLENGGPQRHTQFRHDHIDHIHIDRSGGKLQIRAGLPGNVLHLTIFIDQHRGGAVLLSDQLIEGVSEVVLNGGESVIFGPGLFPRGPSDGKIRKRAAHDLLWLKNPIVFIHGPE